MRYEIDTTGIRTVSSDMSILIDQRESSNDDEIWLKRNFEKMQLPNWQ